MSGIVVEEPLEQDGDIEILSPLFDQFGDKPRDSLTYQGNRLATLTGPIPYG